MRAELDGILCSGGRRGKQFTYALLDERAPHAKTLGREEALAELAGRYFTSHGPATVHDFVWWSGLTGADARVGLHMVRSHLEYEVVDGQTYWFSASPSLAKDLSLSKPTCYPIMMNTWLAIPTAASSLTCHTPRSWILGGISSFTIPWFSMAKQSVLGSVHSKRTRSFLPRAAFFR